MIGHREGTETWGPGVDEICQGDRTMTEDDLLGRETVEGIHLYQKNRAQHVKSFISNNTLNSQFIFSPSKGETKSGERKVTQNSQGSKIMFPGET